MQARSSARKGEAKHSHTVGESCQPGFRVGSMRAE